MEISDLVARLRRNWMVWLSVVVVAIATAAIWTGYQKKTYSAGAVLQVYPVGPSVNPSTITLLIPALMERVDGPTYSQLVRGSSLWTSVSPGDTTVLASGNTTTGLFTITATGTSRQAVAPVANAYAGYLVKNQATEAQFSNVVLLQSAVSPTASSGTSKKAVLVGSTLLGVIVGALIALALDAWRRQRRDPVRYRRTYGVEVLTTIPKVSLRRQPGLMPPSLFTSKGMSDVLESFQTLQVNLGLLARGHPGTCIAISSVTGGEGRSTVAANLSWALARAGLVVTVIDADMRNPSQRKLLGLSPVASLRPGAVPEHQLPATSWETWDERSGPGHGIGPAGAVLAVNVPPHGHIDLATLDVPGLHPAEVISSRFPDLLRWASAHSDIVIVDTPPLESSPETVGILVPTRQAILVVEERHTEPSQIRRWVKELRRLDVTVLGVAVNKTRGRSQGLPMQPGEPEEAFEESFEESFADAEDDAIPGGEKDFVGQETFTAS